MVYSLKKGNKMPSFKKPFKVSGLRVGVDFGTTKVCVVIGKESSEGIQLIGIGKQNCHGIRRGMVINIPVTVDALKKAVQAAELMADCQILEARVAIGGVHVQSFNSSGVVAIKGSEITRHDIDRAIDAAKAVAIPPDREIIDVIPYEFIVNNQDGVKDPIGMSGVRLEAKVHVMTGSISAAQNVIKCFTQAGIKVSELYVGSLSSAEAVLTPDEKELGIALIDIGGGTTDIAIFAHGSMIHSAVIPIGGNHVTNDIAVGLRTSIQEAEKIKLSHGCALASMLSNDEVFEVPSIGAKKSKEVSKTVLAKIIEPRMEEILSLVNQELVNSGIKQLLSAGVVITGGSSLFEGLVELTEFVLELPVRSGYPENVSGLSDIVNSPIYAAAVGLLKIGEEKVEKKSEPLIFNFEKVKNWLSEIF